MKPNPIVAALIAALAVSTSLMAEEPFHRPGPPPRGPLFKALDADEDGTLSSGEIDGSTNSLRTLDENSDGDLSPEELKIKRPPPAPRAQENSEGPPPAGQQPADDADAPQPPEHEQQAERPPHPPRPVPPLMVALDADRDGTLSSDELEAAPESLAALDQNGDGELSEDELRPAPPEGPPPHGERPLGPPPHRHGPKPDGAQPGDPPAEEPEAVAP